MSSEEHNFAKNIKVCLGCNRNVELPFGHRLNVCSHCGAVQSKFVVAPKQTPEEGRIAAREVELPANNANTRRDYSCPKCGYEHTQRVEIVYQSGTHTSIGAVVGASSSGIGAGVGASQSQSKLSSTLAPPKAINPDTAAAFALVLTVVVGVFALMLHSGLGMLVFVAGVVWAVFVSRSAVHFNEEKLPGLVAQWKQKFFCQRCGEIFISPDGK